MAGTLVLLRPSWEGHELSSNGPVLEGVAGPTLVRSPAHELRVQPLEEALASSFERLTKPGWVVATSPASAQALRGQPRLLEALGRRAQSISWAAVGEATAQALRSVLVSMVGEVRDILYPPGVGDAQALLVELGTQPPAAVALLESVGNRAALADGLTGLGWTVTRWALYRRIPRPLVDLRAVQAPLWVLLSSSGQVRSAIDSLSAQGLRVLDVQWLTHHPAIAALLLDQLPGASITMLARPCEEAALAAIKLQS
jgi:uroporphyrinogen-III synthase